MAINDGFQYLEQRDAEDTIIKAGVAGKKTAFCTSDNKGLYDVIAENLRYLNDLMVLNITNTATAWAASTAFSAGALVVSSSLASGCVAQCTTPGTTGTTEPDWGTLSVGQTVTDGTAVWTVRKKLIDLSEFALLASPEFTGTATAQNLTVSGTLTGALTGNADTATKATQDANGNVIADTYETKSDHATDKTAIDNNLTQLNYRLWKPGTAVKLGQVKESPSDTLPAGCIAQCTTAGTTGTTEPAWGSAAGTTITDGTVVWSIMRNFYLYDEGSGYEVYKYYDPASGVMKNKIHEWGLFLASAKTAWSYEIVTMPITLLVVNVFIANPWNACTYVSYHRSPNCYVGTNNANKNYFEFNAEGY